MIIGQACGQFDYAAGDVVADQAHTIQTVDAAEKGLVDVPDFDGGVADGVDVRLGAYHDDQVGELDEGAVSCVGRCPVTSIPTSASACAESSLTADLACVPADVASIVAAAVWRIRPCAMTDLPELLTQTNSTLAPIFTKRIDPQFRDQA